MDKAKTPNAARLQEEAELDKKSRFGIMNRYDGRGPIGRVVDKLSGSGDGYGTSRSAGARAAGSAEVQRVYEKEGKTVGQALSDPRPRQKMREAAAEERREARGYAKGGEVRGYGAARKPGRGCKGM